MPFTFSHPAIVLPLTAKRIHLSATGLIIGSMTPDFEYFIRMKNISRYSHTLAGLFWFDIPLALLLCFIYHLIVRNSLFDNLPDYLRGKVVQFQNFQWTQYFKRHWVLVVLSVSFGAASHILWDGFTHESMFFVQKDPELSTLMTVGNINLASYRFLQLASSIVGLAIVVAAVISLKSRPHVRKKVNVSYWWLICVIIATVMFMRFVGGLNIHDHRKVLVSIISSVFIALILTPMIFSQQEQIRREQLGKGTA